MERFRGAIWVAGALALPLIALGLLLSLIDDSVDALDPPTPAVSMPVDVAPLELSIGAAVVVEFGDEVSIRAPEGWGGLVTSVNVVPGQVVASGTPILSINGVARLAIHTSAPFYRRLALRDKGSDVAMLQQALRGLGLFEGEADGSYGSETADAVHVLSAMLGANTKVFDPSWFVWLPTARVTAGRVEMLVGDIAPSGGTPVVIADRSIVRTTLEAQTNPVPVISSWVFTSQDSSAIDVAWQEDHWSIVDDDALRRSLLRQPSSGEELLILEGRLSPAAEIDTIQVPSSAVMSGAAGNICVWTPHSDGWRPVDVDVVWSTPFGQSQLAPGASLDVVLANPREFLLGGAICP